ncbi:hypothetical protein [uncultured Odoribacter sp.]|uniref:hypothetical protein n=1 Tax=uncultured Odoribacter sp. TaxID=876416 RepID=UPI0026277EDC|nr:hypothetical protein [uncultured Odoribacter sp.]
MYILSTVVKAIITRETIYSTCRILHDSKRKVNKSNVIKELKDIVQDKGSVGIEYIYDRDMENLEYDGLEEDVKRICRELGIN